MAEEPKALSVSFRQDTGSIEHNNRVFIADNVDSSRSPDNIVYVKKDLRELYHELFDEALAEYNAKQTRADRRIDDYYEHIKRGKKEKLFQEVVVTFGNCETCGLGSENWETAKRLLDEYMKEFVKRNPNLKVFNAVMHLDEATPHLHIDFVPVCYDQKQGLKTRVSMKRAIQQMLGVASNKKKECEAVLWCNSERKAMTKILNEHQIYRNVVGACHDHLALKDYRKYIKDLSSLNHRIKTLTERNSQDLTSEEIGDIINQNKLLREALERKEQEANKYKTMALSDFVPVEIYDDDKRQYIISVLERQQIPFVEEEHSLYVQECYCSSVKKIAAEYRPDSNLTIRDKLKFTLDRLVYTAVSFNNMLELLEQMGYKVKRQKYIAIKPPYAQRFMRLRTLGGEYTELSMKERIANRNQFLNKIQQESEIANAVSKPFYAAITGTVTSVRIFEYTPTKLRRNEIYTFNNDAEINRMTQAIATLGEYNICSREGLYKTAEEIRKQLDNNDDDNDLKIRYSRISDVIHVYEEIIEGDYINNLICREKEKQTAKDNAEKKKEEPKTQTAQTAPQPIIRKPKKFGRH